MAFCWLSLEFLYLGGVSPPLPPPFFFLAVVGDSSVVVVVLLVPMFYEKRVIESGKQKRACAGCEE